LGTPPIEELNAAKVDSLRLAHALQEGHSQGWSDWLNERIFSNFVSQSGQTYS